jgi:hypothetical protein
MIEERTFYASPFVDLDGNEVDEWGIFLIETNGTNESADWYFDSDYLTREEADAFATKLNDEYGGEFSDRDLPLIYIASEVRAFIGNAPRFAGLLSLLTRADRIAYLEYGDRDGVFSDEDCTFELGRPLSDQEVEDLTSNLFEEWFDGTRDLENLSDLASVVLAARKGDRS